MGSRPRTPTTDSHGGESPVLSRRMAYEPEGSRRTETYRVSSRDALKQYEETAMKKQEQQKKSSEEQQPPLPQQLPKLLDAAVELFGGGERSLTPALAVSSPQLSDEAWSEDEEHKAATMLQAIVRGRSERAQIRQKVSETPAAAPPPLSPVVKAAAKQSDLSAHKTARPMKSWRSFRSFVTARLFATYASRYRSSELPSSLTKLEPPGETSTPSSAVPSSLTKLEPPGETSKPSSAVMSEGLFGSGAAALITAPAIDRRPDGAHYGAHTRSSRQPTSTLGHSSFASRRADARCFTVVLTGGPCGGKSTSLGPLASALRAKGWQVRERSSG